METTHCECQLFSSISPYMHGLAFFQVSHACFMSPMFKQFVYGKEQAKDILVFHLLQWLDYLDSPHIFKYVCYLELLKLMAAFECYK